MESGAVELGHSSLRLALRVHQHHCFVVVSQCSRDGGAERAPIHSKEIFDIRPPGLVGQIVNEDFVLIAMLVILSECKCECE